jgi:nucleoside-diphosphate-sugar epimerase
VGSGNNLFQPVHAKDLGDAYWKLLTSEEDLKGKQYNLTGNNQISYIEMLKLISLNIGKNNVFIPLPLLICIACVHIYVFFHNIYRWREKYPEKSLIVTVEQVYRMNEDKVFSWKKASDDFGYSPMTFEEGIRSQIKELQSNDSSWTQ